MTDVYGFKGKYEFLSNFYPSKFRYLGEQWSTVEHAFQAAKTTPEFGMQIQAAATPGEAKRLGRQAPLRHGWNQYRVHVMHGLLMCKFGQNKDLRYKLLGCTGYIEETNHWEDTFWGVCNGVGENWLGRLLMEVRDTL